MQVDYLVIGQGISGTWLSYYLQQEGRSFLVIDNNDKHSASRLAAGIINPVTGRRHVKVWMAETLLPFAQDAYTQLGAELGCTAISPKKIVDFFPNPQMRVSFMQRVEEKAGYVFPGIQPERFRAHFNYEFGYGEIDPVYTIHLEKILPLWRQQLLEKNCLREEEFELNELQLQPGKIAYKNIHAKKIIFCDGVACASNPWFDLLPFAPNKGELLVVSIPDLPSDHIYKKGMMLAPLSTKDLWWVGSSYAWEFEHPHPTSEFRERTEALLKQWLIPSFQILDHFAGIRPATLERRPFVGLHPVNPEVGLLNGMGAKGCSLAPLFARQLVDHLCYAKPIDPEADVQRFRKILSRNSNQPN